MKRPTAHGDKGEYEVPPRELVQEPAVRSSAINLTLRFAPTALGAAHATITVVSDDPASPATVAVSGAVPAGKLAVADSAVFNDVKCCKRE